MTRRHLPMLMAVLAVLGLAFAAPALGQAPEEDAEGTVASVDGTVLQSDTGTLLVRTDDGDMRFVSATDTYEFEVEAVQIVDERNLAVLSPTEGPTITLITCYPFTYVGPAPKRWVVHARLIDEDTASTDDPDPGAPRP